MFDILVTTSRGLDSLLMDEIQTLCPDVSLSNKPGQVLFKGTLLDAYRLCLWSRLANRVYVELAKGEINSGEDVYHVANQVNWSSQFSVDNDFVVDFTGTNRHITNTQFGALKIKDAIVDHFSDLFDERPSVSKQSPDLRFHGRLRRNELTVYLDLSGQSLHQRHYREDTGAAPLKEHVASAVLMRSGWTKNMDKPLVDPMCGSGTIAIEAALMAADMAPGLNRPRWGFKKWKQHDDVTWTGLVDEAQSRVKEPSVTILANDVDQRVVAMAKRNADAAGVFRSIQFSSRDALKFTSPGHLGAGYLVCNPPYGERLGELTSLLPLFQKWGVHLKRHFVQWNMSLLTSNRDLLRQLKLLSNKEYKLNNGSLECQVINYTLDEQNCVIKESQNEGDFANRLKKNLKKLNKWAKNQDIDCYRIYDADLPEYNVAVDKYLDWLVVQEYAAPKDVPEQKARRRLHEVLIALPQVTGVDPDKLILKTRAQQKGTNQYQKTDDKKETLTVSEYGAKFIVNLRDYLDTGLFLDHRITRQKVKSLAKGKDVLNLFSYTGSVSVQAALGKARSITTVDMSRTYIDWAKDNFRLNNLKGAYEFVQADCTTWITSHNARYDLIFVDPPSFSNSKRMGTTWDVQRDHVELLSHCARCLKPGGTLIFSNNLRQFKLDQQAMEELGLKVTNISQDTLPEDFKRNPKIHHCWVMERQS